MRLRTRFLFSCCLLFSCSPLKKTTNYYSRNQRLTEDLYSSYLAVNRQIPLGGLQLTKGSYKNQIEVRYNLQASVAEVIHYDSTGANPDGIQRCPFPEVFRGDDFRKLMTLFRRSRYFAMDGFEKREDYLFLAFGPPRSRFNQKDFLGILMSSTGNYTYIRKVGHNAYVAEHEVH